MKPIHAQLWKALEAYVGEACDGRDDSHGLPHMRLVTEHAIALFNMTNFQETAFALMSGLATEFNAAEPIDMSGASEDAMVALEGVRVLLSYVAGPNENDVSLAAFFIKRSLHDFGTFNYEYLSSGQKTLSLSAVEAAGASLHSSAVMASGGDKAIIKGLVAWATAVMGYFNAMAVPKQKALCDAAAEKTTTAGAKNTTLTAFDTALARCIVIGMLHDVNDHKYEKPDGSLSKGLLDFVNAVLVADDSAFLELLFPSADINKAATSDRRANVIMRCVSAISFSKEKKNGMRYFVESLGEEWTAVRDWVSDADKLEAIGEGGLNRCWNFNLEMKAHKEGNAAMQAIHSDADKKEALRQANFRDVRDHVDEKLAILKDQYIVTAAGKRLATVAHDEMLSLLQLWILNGPPQL